MTIYEQIQKALDRIEQTLAEGVSKQEVSRDAGMSLRSFQHYFWAVTGLSYKEYVVKRRLTEGAVRLVQTRDTILRVALDCGYQTHESFTRAFRIQFGVTPLAYRQAPVPLAGLGRIQTYKELAMGVILKELPALNALAFDGWGPEPELRAHELLEAWKTAHPETGTPGRLFGHNLTAEGTLAFGPSHAGYRLLLTVPAPDGQTTVALEPGRFAVTGIEGSFADDPAGAWITAGWARMTALAAEKGYRLKEQGRWFEEELEPRTPGNLRLDLYVELEGGKD